MMSGATRRRSLGCLVTVLVITAVLVGCENKERREVLAETPASLVLFSTVQPTAEPTVALPAALLIQPTAASTSQPTATPFSLGPLCEQAGLDPVGHYVVLATRHAAPRLKPPFNLAARRAAGFNAEELARLQAP